MLEAGMMEAVDIRDFVPGSKEEEDIRGELNPHLAKVSFPAAQLEPGRSIAESDDIIAFLAVKSGREPASLPVLGNYVEGALKPMMKLWKENVELKSAAAWIVNSWSMRSRIPWSWRLGLPLTSRTSPSTMRGRSCEKK